MRIPVLNNVASNSGAEVAEHYVTEFLENTELFMCVKSRSVVDIDACAWILDLVSRVLVEQRLVLGSEKDVGSADILAGLAPSCRA